MAKFYPMRSASRFPTNCSVLWRLAVWLTALAAGSAQADSLCFAQVQTSYEQLYCEVKAAGRGQGLPPLYEFRNNDVLTQALLLQRPAAAIGLVVPRPSRSVAAAGSGASAIAITPIAAPARLAKARPAVERGAAGADPAACQLQARAMLCPQGRFVLRGNQANRLIDPSALAPENKLELPEYRGDLEQRGQVLRHLSESYRLYLEKMLAIGLGGSTLSFAKFVFLFDDLSEKGVSFNARFASMYEYLKRDKASIAVSEALNLPADLSAADCEVASSTILVCNRGGNYLFLLEN